MNFFLFNKDIELTREEIEKLIQEKSVILKELFEKIGKTSNYIKELSEIAFLQLGIEQYDESEKNFLICLKHFKKQRDRLGQAAVLGVLGTLYFKKSEYEKAIENYKNAYNIYNELKQVKEEITCLKGLGNSYIKLNKLDDACELFLECSEICSDDNDIYNLLDCLGNLIYIHETQEKWDIVYDLYKKSLEAFVKLKDNKGIITSYFNLGIIEKRNNRYYKALLSFKKGTNQAIDSNFVELIMRGLGYIGETLFYLGKFKEAKKEFIKALHLAEKLKATNAIFQLKTLIKSLGLSDKDIENELKDYKKTRNKNHKNRL
ncbi:MAG: tetratricopeptide repeat protein [Candidatus Hodarchaeota archaeon]